jgi:hypothetical protein
MTGHLWPLLRIKGASDDEVREKYREIFVSTYVKTKDGEEINITDWNDNRIRFSLLTFDHAFSEATDYRFSYGVHNVPFSYKRACRILWIKEALSASAGTIERRSQLRRDSRGRTRKRRVLIVVEERYVVVLEDSGKTKELNFISAFPADTSYLEKIRRESALLETKNPSLNGD